MHGSPSCGVCKRQKKQYVSDVYRTILCLHSAMPPAPNPRDRPFNLPRNPKYTAVRDVTDKTRSPARGFVTAAVAAREYWPA